MSRKFVRNVTGTKLKGEKIEPFDTNVQNDLLSDETDVYVRQERSKDIEDKYHCLTDDVKEVISNSDLISTENFEHGESEQEDKNKSYINVNKSNKTESEKMESNSHVMTPFQTGYAIEKNNRDVIPGLVKQHETPTEIESKSDKLKVKKVSKNNFELELETNTEINPLNNISFTFHNIIINSDLTGLYIGLRKRGNDNISFKDIEIELHQVIQSTSSATDNMLTHQQISANLYNEELKINDALKNDENYVNFIRKNIVDTGTFVFYLHLKYKGFHKIITIPAIKQYIQSSE